ncbi:MAG: hypothetical protein A3K68_06600 [Euryarchaeota archaeon RBG_16_68_13]|nr:MAG: hypothetical protein A3K68_06600 [Euryarchaeota archaeon RBG_16_68_13]
MAARVDAFAAARLVTGTGLLALASAWDVRTRRVPDPLWIALGAAGLVLLAAESVLSGAGLEAYALAGGTAILFAAVFFGDPLFDEHGFRLRPARLGAFGLAGVLVGWGVVAARDLGDPRAASFWQLLTMPALVLVYQTLYQVGLLHGGADAKALIALTLLVPTYPDAFPWPLLAIDPLLEPAMRILFPFSFVAFVDAAVLYLTFPVGFLAVNTARGDLRWPQALFGFRADLDRLPKHVWLMERIDDRGEHVLVLMPRRRSDPEEQARKLRDAGIHRAWVQPKVPFMVPLFAGFLAAFLVGNFLAVLFG